MKDIAVIIPHFNPQGYERPRENLRTVLAHLKEFPVDVHLAEVSFDGQRHFEQARYFIEATDDQRIWQKERLINLVAEEIHPDYRCLVWLDGDCLFENPNWCFETLMELQYANIVQMYECKAEIQADGSILNQPWYSMASVYRKALKKDSNASWYKASYYGSAWAARRSYFEQGCGLYDRAIVGGGDLASVLGWCGWNDDPDIVNLTEGLTQDLRTWAEEAYEVTLGRVGYLPDQTIRHLWHGNKNNRQYVSRFCILKKHNYDPAKDLVLASNGLWSVVPEKHDMLQDIKQFFAKRAEDTD